MRHWKLKKNLSPVSASELYRQSDRRLSTKLVANSWIEGCHVVRMTGRILDFLNRSRYFIFQVAPHLQLEINQRILKINFQYSRIQYNKDERDYKFII
jgi:hypothetical protein